MDLHAIRRVHDAAIALGAECDSSSCVFNNGGGAIDQVKSYTLTRAHALMFLQGLMN
jgi:hypothetical protein